MPFLERWCYRYPRTFLRRRCWLEQEPETPWEPEGQLLEHDELAEQRLQELAWERVSQELHIAQEQRLLKKNETPDEEEDRDENAAETSDWAE
jgi:hypothetical protein